MKFIEDLNIKQGQPLDFRIAVEDDADHIGGVTLFGKTFGNYSQDIRVSLNYKPIE